jgi:hypothetical protein
MATCAQCGNALPAGARFCGQCGSVTVVGAGAPGTPGSASAGQTGASDAPLAAPPASPSFAAPAPGPLGALPAPAPIAPPAPSVPSAPSVRVPSPLAQTQLTPGPQSQSQPPPRATNAPAPHAQALPSAKKTMMGIAIGGATAPPVVSALADTQPASGSPAAQFPIAPPAMHAPARTAAAKTMIGVAMPGIAPERDALPAALGAQRPPQAPSPESPITRSRTMLGVAMPGIAPLHEGTEAPAGTPAFAPPPPSVAPAGSPVEARFGGTMMGVAVPGIAPLHPGCAPGPSSMPAPMGAPSAPPHVMGKLAHTVVPPAVPMPPPLVAEAPRRRAKKGIPLSIVAAIVGGLLLVGGTIIALLYHAPAPIRAQPRLDAQGKEELLLTCADCKDGTVAELDGARTTFHAGEARLSLAKPLEVGDNALAIQIDRPGAGRDDTVKLAVPVAFRIRADLADIAARPPVITVRVGATPGSEVKVDGKALTLDAAGRGAYTLDVSADTEGLADDLRVIDRKVPYTVTLPGGTAESGEVSARVAVAPLHVDSPTSHAVIDAPSFVVAGRTQPGGSVTLDDQPVATAPDGSFAQALDARAGGEDVVLRASAPSRAARTVHLAVKRVTSLEAEAKAFEGTHPLGYDTVAADIASKVGQRVVLVGDVLEARVDGHQVVALVDDRRGCAHGPCLARVTAGEGAKIARGDVVRVYGRVTRAVTASNGKAVPEVEADFVLKGRGPR